MAQILSLFPTLIYRADAVGSEDLNAGLEDAAFSLARDDVAGQRWCDKHGYAGYTSYGSLDDLSWRIPAFRRLERLIDGHAAAFARELHWNLRKRKPRCDSLWVNVLEGGGAHSSHIHPNSVLSGTYYVSVPPGAGPIVYEDPRLPLMMAAPARKSSTPEPFRSHVSAAPAAGTLLLWESWLRHEVPVNRAEGARISVSFNYIIG